MLKTLFSLLLLAAISTSNCCAQSNNFLADVEAYRAEMDKKFRDAKESPLTAHDRSHFPGLKYYAPDEGLRFEAKFKRTRKAKPFKMNTSSGKLKDFVKYGEAQFEVDGKKVVLCLYQNLAHKDHPEHGKYLFVPFTDHTNGSETYGGGRYMDIEIPKGKQIVIDFNKCYNPYCAYSTGWSCPIPPEENALDMPIRAGVKKYEHRHHH